MLFNLFIHFNLLRKPKTLLIVSRKTNKIKKHKNKWDLTKIQDKLLRFLCIKTLKTNLNSAIVA
jgi:hypothetical protein